MGNYVFFLGGEDREMNEIKNILAKVGQKVFDKNLGWGAKVSAYVEEIFQATEEDQIPVLVELELDIEIPKISVVIDHHGKRAGEPPAIIQVLSLLGIEPTRHQVLVGAWDTAGREGLEALHLSYEEMRIFLGGSSPVFGGPKEGTPEYDKAMKQIASDSYLGDQIFPRLSGGESVEFLLRKEDERFFSEEILSESDRAVNEAVSISELIIVRSSHNKTRPICNQIFSQRSWGNGKKKNLLILSKDGETNFFGKGNFVKKLRERFPRDSWSGGPGIVPQTEEGKKFWEENGGSPPDSGFFGSSKNQKNILDFVVRNHDPKYWEKNRPASLFLDKIQKIFSRK